MAPPISDPTVSVRAIRPLLERLDQEGIDTAQLLSERGLDTLGLEKDEVRIPLRYTEGLWEQAAALTDDPWFGLHLAESVQTSSFGLFSYLAVMNATWGSALQTISDYFGLLSDVSGYCLRTEGSQASLSLEDWPAQTPSPQLVDFSLAVVACYGRTQLGDRFALQDVLLPYPEPKARLSSAGMDAAQPRTAAPYQRIFAAPIRFSSRQAAIRFPAAMLQEPLSMAEPELANILIASAESELGRISAEPVSWLDSVKAAIRSALRQGDSSLPSVATLLGTAPRNLQRKLQSENVSYREIQDEVLCGVASNLLSRGDLGIAEIAALMGYSEAAAFHRSFKRWTGQTPAQYRQRVQQRRLS